MQATVPSVNGVEDVIPFLKAYPFPAWISVPIAGGRTRLGFTLKPAWSNPAFDTLIGSHSAFLTAIENAASATEYGSWLELNEKVPTTYTIKLRLSWEDENSPESTQEKVVELELVRTNVIDSKGDRFAVCTSIWRSPFPLGSSPRRNRKQESKRKQKAKPLKLLDLPSFRSSIPGNGSSSSSTSTVSIVQPFGRGFNMREMVQSFPWERTPLGPREGWDKCLQQMCELTLTSPFPAAIWWGPDLVLLYNDAYAEMSTTKHPRIFGQKGMDAWSEIWDVIGPAFRECMKGNPAFKHDDLLLMDRLDSETQPLEETYHTWSWTPILNSERIFTGLFNTTLETTAKVIAERRISTLQTLGSRAATAQDREAFCQATLSTLEENDKDIPFAMLYLIESSSAAHDSVDPYSTPQALNNPKPITGGTQISFRLKGSVGIPEDHKYVPSKVDVIVHPFNGSYMQTSDSFEWPFEQSLYEKSPFRFAIPKEIAVGFQKRGWGDLVSHGVIMSLSPESDSRPLGILLVGLNTRRNYDSDYSLWIDVLRAAVSSYLTGSIAREEEVRRSDHLAELDAAKTALFSNASHELRTPLTLISAPIKDLLSEIEDSKVKMKLMTASRNVDRLARLVDSLMDFSRLEAGRLEGRYTPVQFGEYVAEQANLFRPVIEKAGLEYTVTYDPNETRLVFIDHDYMEKIIFNLIGNAFKYTMAGSIAVEVIYTEADASLLVRDTGVGIPATDLPQIWDRFHRVEATSRSHEGTGIGLALTKQFVQLHGGTISVVSAVPNELSDEHGSTFIAAFPLGKDHLPAARLYDSPQSSRKQNYARGIVAEAARWRLVGDAVTPSDSDESYTSSDGQRNTEFSFEPSDLVLLVDDNQDMLEYIKNIFSRFCHVRTASNGQLGLEIARKHPPNLIISDVMMPVLDGFGLVNALKEDPMLKIVPIILLTARAGDSNKAEGILSGADDYIAKPFSSKELLARANFHIQIGKKRQEMETRFQERTKEVQILTDLSPSGLFRVDTEGKMLLFNDRFRELSGMNAETNASSEMEWLELVHPDFRDKVEETLKTSLETHQPGQVDFAFKNGNWVQGHVRWWARGLVGTVTDMSLTRLYEESLTRRAEEAEERRIEAEERRRGQELLVDVTSHELRQPVSAVINCANVVFENLKTLRQKLGECVRKNESYVIEDGLLEQLDEDLESLNAIELCGLAQGHIVNDILTLSRMQLHMLTLQDAVFPLAREIRQVCSILFNEMKSKGIKHSLVFGNSIQTLGVKYVSVDKVRFGQVIINLLSNAIRFSQNSIAKEIEINVDVSRSPPLDESSRKPDNLPEDMKPINNGEENSIYVYVSVHDSGPGLKPKDLELLFQRFQKGTNSEEIFGGSGLGLFVSRKICDLLGGRIEVDANSVGEKGSTFRFYVRMKTAPAPVQVVPKNVQSQISITSPLRILVAEDNQINRTILIRQLKANHCIPVGAINGAEAVDLVVKAGDESFDCILMDCEMPVMSGLDATRELRRLESSGLIPPQRIIALTGNARSEQLQNALDSGMDEVMTKPYRLNELLERLRSPPRWN